MRTVVAWELMKNKDGGNPEINNKIVPMYWGNEISIFQDKFDDKILMFKTLRSDKTSKTSFLFKHKFSRTNCRFQ